MSLTGLKKQFNKANQLLNEKIAGARGTELDSEYLDMEKNIDACAKLFEDLQSQTQTYLQPNATSRALLMTRNALSKVQGKQASMSYPQPEGRLAECLMKHSTDLKLMPTFSDSLKKTGETFVSLADHKYALEDKVKQNFLLPLAEYQNRELKEISLHRKKVQSRRLDFDCKKRQDKTGGESEEVRVAETKFLESKELAGEAMQNFLGFEVEMIQALRGFLDATVDYHERALEEMRSLRDEVAQQCQDVESRPRRSIRSPSQISKEIRNSSMSLQSNQSIRSVRNEPVEPKIVRKDKIEGGQGFQATPTCRAIFDFHPESEQELPFKEGDVIKLLEQLDENWFFGELNGKKGHFPVNYVEVLIPL